MADGPNAWQLIGGVGGVATLCGGLWGAIQWVFGRADRKEAALEAKEAQLVAKLEQAVKDQGARIEALEADSRKLWMVIGYVVPALHAHDPKSPALKMASTILGSAFPIDLSTPPDMTDTLRKI